MKTSILNSYEMSKEIVGEPKIALGFYVAFPENKRDLVEKYVKEEIDKSLVTMQSGVKAYIVKEPLCPIVEIDRRTEEIEMIQEREHILVPARDYFKYREKGYVEKSDDARVGIGMVSYYFMSKTE